MTIPPSSALSSVEVASNTAAFETNSTAFHLNDSRSDAQLSNSIAALNHEKQITAPRRRGGREGGVPSLPLNSQYVSGAEQRQFVFNGRFEVGVGDGVLRFRVAPQSWSSRLRSLYPGAERRAAGRAERISRQDDQK